MGRYFGSSVQEMGFPDEFGEDICQTRPEQQQTPASAAGRAITPFCGYVTPSWFGPFLLGPQTRQGRGCC